MKIYKIPFYEKMLEKCIDDENYEKASEIRDLLKTFEPGEYYLLDDVEIDYRKNTIVFNKPIEYEEEDDDEDDDD